MNNIITTTLSQFSGAMTAGRLQEITNLPIVRVRVLIEEALKIGDISIVNEDDDILSYQISASGSEAIFNEVIFDAANREEASTSRGDVQEELPPLQEPVEEPVVKAAKAKRVLLNPQPVINKKVDILREAGFSLTYASRTWTITHLATGSTITMNSLTLASIKPAEMVEFAHQSFVDEPLEVAHVEVEMAPTPMEVMVFGVN